MAAGEHHHHKRRANCERRNHASSRANTGASDSQDKEEGSNEFCYVLVHNLRFYQLSRELAIMNDWGKQRDPQNFKLALKLKALPSTRLLTPKS
jgi:hypothetical protein